MVAVVVAIRVPSATPTTRHRSCQRLPRASLLVTWVYRIVTAKDEWPRISWTTRMSTPCSSTSVAAVWRTSCGRGLEGPPPVGLARTFQQGAGRRQQNSSSTVDTRRLTAHSEGQPPRSARLTLPAVRP
ncbi:hypothetical protein EV643_112250 [Kribbella sp. VKM Ac-2527]|uniref:Uncharacterized protein n=1 Tax=Kribbella caucasensis TaxID=2512215 RepID=A0A4R6KB55_9ACTN|nr:hypothetical protein EV643_112250 [Kribbella sp. VKM Ac-2527]